MAAGQLYFNPVSSGMGTSDAYPICIPNPCASPSPQASPSPSPGACDVYSVEASNQPSCPGTLMSITTISDCAFARSVAITSWPGPAPTGGAMVSENSMTVPSGCYYSTTGQVRFNSNTAGTGTTTTHPICIDNPCPAASPSPGACGQFSLEAPNLPSCPGGTAPITSINECEAARSGSPATFWSGSVPTAATTIGQTGPSGCFYTTSGMVEFNPSVTGTAMSNAYPICINNPCASASPSPQASPSPSPGACGTPSIEASNLASCPAGTQSVPSLAACEQLRLNVPGHFWGSQPQPTTSTANNPSTAYPSGCYYRQT